VGDRIEFGDTAVVINYGLGSSGFCFQLVRHRKGFIGMMN